MTQATADPVPVLELRDAVTDAGLAGCSFAVTAGTCHCVLVGGADDDKDNVVNAVAGHDAVTGGALLIDGEPMGFRKPADAVAAGVVTLGQVAPLVAKMSVMRNFWLAREPVKRFGPLKFMDVKRANREAMAVLAAMGIHPRDPDQPVAALADNERRSFAIARAAYFGPRLVVLDAPTDDLDTRDAALVLQTIGRVRDAGTAVLIVSENVRRSFAIGDSFTIVDRGRSGATVARGETSAADLEGMMPAARDFALGDWQ